MNTFGANFLLNEVVPALRSGEYVQGRSVLRREDDSMCCLGVAADKLNPDGWTKDWDGNWQMEDTDGGASVTVLPFGLAQKLGIMVNGSDPEFIKAAFAVIPGLKDTFAGCDVSNGLVSLTNLNDGSHITANMQIDRQSFDSIANVIEYAAKEFLDLE